MVRYLWVKLQWPEAVRDLTITVKELLPILIASALWGHQWVKHRVQCQCDNEAVVAVMKSITSRHHHLMYLLRCLFFIEVCYDLEVTCTHVPGIDNGQLMTYLVIGYFIDSGASPAGPALAGPFFGT